MGYPSLPSFFSLLHDDFNAFHLQIGEGNGNPLQSCLENLVDGGAWWAAVHRVAQSQTRLKRLSSGSSTKETVIVLSFGDPEA